MNQNQYVTQETLDKMKQTLQRMKSVDRPAAAKAIAEAREKGDLKENAEYDAAKNEQGILEAKIKQLESIVSNARVVDASTVNTEQVSILTKVKLTNINTKKEMTYQIVSENEADVKQSKISILSPIGKSLLGKKVGEIAIIQTPAGEMKFRIDQISI